MSSFQEIGSGLISFEMNFEALQSELFRFNFHSLSSKIPKNTGMQPIHNRLKSSFSRIDSIYEPFPKFN